jgi:hypothetical protein
MANPFNADGTTAFAQFFAERGTYTVAASTGSGTVTWTVDVVSAFEPPLTREIANGSASAPSIAFASDTDTGLRRRAANAIAIVAGGIDQLDLAGGVASGAAVQASTIDFTPTKLTTVGGAGGAALSQFGRYIQPGGTTNINLQNAGFQGLVSDTNPGTWPITPNGSFVHISTQSLFTGLAVEQTALYGYAGSGTPGTPRLYRRIRADTGGLWGPWLADFIVSGTNANGTFVRFPDGTQVCRAAIVTTDKRNVGAGASFRSSGASLVFPASFLAGTEPIFLPGTATTSSWFTADPAGTSSVFVRELGLVTSEAEITYRYSAIGRWL